ncbi:MAG: hypothetical protein B0W54_17160 [Cellvibrio sp. 79]|nr:MAG: hypothetical protein B0W54_17160 [Cellvibrio sp. 79]
MSSKPGVVVVMVFRFGCYFYLGCFWLTGVIIVDAPAGVAPIYRALHKPIVWVTHKPITRRCT